VNDALEHSPSRQPEPRSKEPEKQADPGQFDGQPKPPLTRRAKRFVASHSRRTFWGAVLLVVVLIGSLFLFRYLNSYESTDDAQIDGHLNTISVRIPGTVAAVYVEDNQFVRAGQRLVELDPSDYQIALKRAQAAYTQTQAQLQGENPNVPIVQTATQTTISTGQADVITAEAAVSAAEKDYQARLAGVHEVEAQSAKAQTDVKRYEPLVSKDEIPQQLFDAAVATAASQAASVEAARASLEASRQMIEQRRAQLAESQSRLAEAQENAPRQLDVRRAGVATRRAGSLQAAAAVEQAALELSYTKIHAPVDGIVTNRSAEVGSRVQPGEQLLAISQVDDIWVTANFKETQLKAMRPGQSVDIHVDAYGTLYHGYVASMPGASGARTSLLPPENATGNYVKVVQRLPVRIRFNPGQDSEHRLRLGMSAEPKVWLNTNTRPTGR
jgi:membrane fusion protein (multidrug efflux system)